MSHADYYSQKVDGDGNCYFRVLSSFYRGEQNYYQEFRKLIHDVENINKI